MLLFNMKIVSMLSTDCNCTFQWGEEQHNVLPCSSLCVILSFLQCPVSEIQCFSRSGRRVEWLLFLKVWYFWPFKSFNKSREITSLYFSFLIDFNDFLLFCLQGLNYEFWPVYTETSAGFRQLSLTSIPAESVHLNSGISLRWAFAK